MAAEWLQDTSAGSGKPEAFVVKDMSPWALRKTWVMIQEELISRN